MNDEIIKETYDPVMLEESREAEIDIPAMKPDAANLNALYLRYLVLPAIFITVALLGGLRIAGEDGAFVFFRPPLVCLIFGAILLVLFARSGVLRLDGWFSESFTPLKNVANGLVVATLFAAATQIFNSLLPEQGLTFWIVVPKTGMTNMPALKPVLYVA